MKRDVTYDGKEELTYVQEGFGQHFTIFTPYMLHGLQRWSENGHFRNPNHKLQSSIRIKSNGG